MTASTVTIAPFTDGRDNKELIGEKREDDKPKPVTTTDDVGTFVSTNIRQLFDQAGVKTVDSNYPPGASRDPTFGVSGWVSSGGFGNLIGGDSGFAVELAGGADGSSEFIRYYPPMQIRCGTP
jgi:hypothetical protein